MIIEKKNTADLLPADYNPRKDLKPGDAEYEKLKRSIEQFGYVEPVIWNKVTGRVVGGHQRLKVLIDMGISEVECVVVEMDEEKEKALAISMNLLSLKASFSSGSRTTRRPSLAMVAANIEKAGLRLDYLSCVDAKTLQPRKTVAKGCCVLVAAYDGKTRLIDNVLI